MKKKIVLLVFLILLLTAAVMTYIYWDPIIDWLPVDQSGWDVTEIGGRCYLDEDGDPIPGWLEIDERQYYFTDEGTPVTGWQTVDELERYFTADGALATGKVDVEGTTRWFASNGTEIILVNPWNFIPEYYNPEIVTIRDSWWKTSTE